MTDHSPEHDEPADPNEATWISIPFSDHESTAEPQVTAAEDALVTLDELSTTLDTLREELDALEEDDGPRPAA